MMRSHKARNQSHRLSQEATINLFIQVVEDHEELPPLSAQKASLMRGGTFDRVILVAGCGSTGSNVPLTVRLSAPAASPAPPSPQTQQQPSYQQLISPSHVPSAPTAKATSSTLHRADTHFNPPAVGSAWRSHRRSP
ncbi:hypothetical protein L3Q82_024410 [Scortum barcoo]|uniref:Uncharacterized protein n=1 Tax=Scortum barcoo TaxID=214431 RepID=A0ACB8WPT6_9TELE|nr:hypothetical protein L3Q82_024410 [Scortum barcoo]